MVLRGLVLDRVYREEIVKRILRIGNYRGH